METSYTPSLVALHGRIKQIYIYLAESYGSAGWKMNMSFQDGTILEEWLVSYLPMDLSDEQLQSIAYSIGFRHYNGGTEAIVGKDCVTWRPT